MAILRNVSKQDTLESQRQVINLIASDLYGYTNGSQNVSILAGEFGDGSASNPSLRFSSDVTLGFFKEATSTLGISSNGKQVVSIAASGTYFTRNFYGQRRSLTTAGLSISDSGTDYEEGSYTNISLLGGSGLGATANIVVNASGNVSGVTIVNDGYGYAVGDSLYVNDKEISDGDGISGDVKTLSVTEEGFNYVNGTTYSTNNISGSGLGSGLTVSVTTELVGKVLELGFLNGGSNYTTTTNAPFTTNGSGTGLTLNIIAAVNGLVEILSPVDYGTGYSTTGSSVATTTDGIGTGLTVNYSASVGGILNAISITNDGSGYPSSGTDASLTGGTGSGGTVNFTASPTDSLLTFNIVEEGTGYTDGELCNIQIVDENITEPGTGAQITVTASGGLVTGGTVTAAGTGFTVGEQYYLIGGNDNAIFQVASVTPGGDLLTVSINNGGSGYTVNDVLTVSTPSSSSGTVTVTDVTGGVISSVTIVDKGTNYEVGDTITISGGDNNASYTVTDISGGAVTQVSINTNNSSGFVQNETITFTGGDANASITVTSVTAGEITGVTVVDPGQDYNIGDVLQVSGGGGTGEITVSETFDGSGFTLSVNNISLSSPITADLSDGSISSLIGYIDTLLSDTGTITNLSTNTISSSVSITSPSILSSSTLNITSTDDVNISSPNLNIGSNLTLESSTGNIFSDGRLEATEIIVDNKININDNSISTLADNPLLLVPSNNKITKVDSTSALVIPVGATNQRPLSNAETGAIRFNSDIQQYEGYNASTNLWSSLGGVRDSDGNTYIIPELNSGSNDNILYFFNNSVNTIRLSESQLQFYNLSNISALSGTLNINSTDVSFSNNLKISSNKISTTSSSLTIEPATGTNVVISGIASLAIPVGTSAQRGTSVAGGIRYNTSISQFEGYNGTNWTSLGGVRDVDGNTYVVPESFPGANDNVLYFVSNGIHAARITSAELRLEGASTLNSVNLTGISEWQSVTAYTTGTFVYYGTNVYQVSTNFTSGGTPPSHTSGTTSNLTWIRTIYGNITIDSNVKNFIINTTLDISNQLKITNSNIFSVSEDINIQPFTSKKVKIDSLTSLVIPAGTSLERGTPDAGSIRYNTTVSQFEGYSGTAWTSLGGVRDVDGNTYIIPETSPGSNENILYFYNDDINTLRLSPTELIFQNIDTITSNSNVLDINSNLVEFNSGLFNIDTSVSTRSKLYTTQNNLDLALSSGLSNDTLLRLSGSGQLAVNTSFGSGSESYVNILDKNLNNFDLAHLNIKTSKYTLVKDTNNFNSYILFDPSLAESCKVTVIAVNATTGDKHMVDYNVIAEGSDIYNIEYESLTSGDLLYDASFDFSASGEARITTTLLNNVTSGNTVNFTIVNTIIKK